MRIRAARQITSLDFTLYVQTSPLAAARKYPATQDVLTPIRPGRMKL
jgi:hypothetical protein